MRTVIAVAGVLLAASAAAAGEIKATAEAPNVAAMVTTGQTGVVGEAALTVAPTAKAKAPSAYGGMDGCNHSRSEAKAPLLLN
jgi:hypothetical protein